MPECNGPGLASQREANLASDAENPELWPATYPPTGEDAETPWLPTDPIPNPEPEAPGLVVPDPGIYESSSMESARLQ